MSSGKNVAHSIQLQTLINNSGREMPQYRAQHSLKIEHAPMPEEWRGRREKQREVAWTKACVSTNWAAHGCCSNLALHIDPSRCLFAYPLNLESKPIIIINMATATRATPSGSGPCSKAYTQKKRNSLHAEELAGSTWVGVCTASVYLPTLLPTLPASAAATLQQYGHQLLGVQCQL